MDLKMLYGNDYNKQNYIDRVEELKNTFIAEEKCSPDYIFSSPGRAEILGNHTDHNHGLVMVSSISCDTLAVVKKTNDNIVKICSHGFKPIEFNLNDVSIHKNEFGKSIALARGVAKGINNKGYSVGGFTAYTQSTVFKGAGVSSSASFEVLISEIFNYLYLGGKLSPLDKAIISQFAENEYFGKPCGLLDQSGISIGSLTKIDFKNPTSPIVTKLTPPSEYSLVITNTGGNHSVLTSHYAAIKTEMHEIANYFGKEFLRDVSYNDFMSNIANLKHHFNGRSILRALHFFNENERVLRAEKALKEHNLSEFLNCVNESGLSSLSLLQNCMVPDDKEQPVVLGIEYSRQIIKNGAIRVHGGGFAGSILAFVSHDEVDHYMSCMSNMFGNENVFKADFRTIGTTLVEEI